MLLILIFTFLLCIFLTDDVTALMFPSRYSNKITSQNIAITYQSRQPIYGKKPVSKGKSKGFGKPVIPSQVTSKSESGAIVDNASSSINMSETQSAVGAAAEQLVDAEDVYKKYGIITNDKSKAKESSSVSKSDAVKKDDAAFGEDVLRRIPDKQQAQIDSFLIYATFG